MNMAEKKIGLFQKTLLSVVGVLFLTGQVLAKNYILLGILTGAIAVKIVATIYSKQLATYCEQEAIKRAIQAAGRFLTRLFNIAMTAIGCALLVGALTLIIGYAKEQGYFQNAVALQKTCETKGGPHCARLIMKCEGGDADACISMSGIRKTQELKNEERKYLLRACNLGNNWACGLLR